MKSGAEAGLMCRKDVARFLGVSTRTVYRMERKVPDFPRRVAQSMHWWRTDDIKRWAKRDC